MKKRPIVIRTMLRRIERAVAPYPKAAMFALAELGHRSAFEQLAACILSIRTRDEVALPASLALFELGRTPAEIARRSTRTIDAAIRTVTYHGAKAAQIRAIARRIVDEHDGELPCDDALFLSFAGVGPKCANLVLGIACGFPRISVDVHVDRVTRRWGYVTTTRPEKTLEALTEKLPEQHWIDLNRLLVPFGKHVCSGLRPHCSTCPVLDMCRQVGVVDPR
jgi:endonuclease-3